jgi:hypothetical protein
MATSLRAPLVFVFKKRLCLKSMLWIRSGCNADPDQNLITRCRSGSGETNHADLDLDPGKTSASQKGEFLHENYILYVGNRS